MREFATAMTRRRLMATAAALSITRPGLAANAPWTRQAFEQAMARSGRPCTLTDEQFEAIQARKPAAIKRIADYLQAHRGAADPRVLAAFEAVPR
ncbi:MAG: hypothetical protein JOZ42_04165, partial [Acetobacteraceae bacterium]|nr:hypothetical protein [Acetobacteraceae bacterium]